MCEAFPGAKLEEIARGDVPWFKSCRPQQPLQGLAEWAMEYLPVFFRGFRPELPPPRPGIARSDALTRYTASCGKLRDREEGLFEDVIALEISLAAGESERWKARTLQVMDADLRVTPAPPGVPIGILAAHLRLRRDAGRRVERIGSTTRSASLPRTCASGAMQAAASNGLAAPPFRSTAAAPSGGSREASMANYPETLRYTKEHEWARIAGKTATIGITEFAKDQLGDVVYLELPEVGATVTRGQPFGVVESTKAVSELFAPVSGKVTKINQALVDAPEGINDDPHEKGWMIEVEMSAPNETGELLSAKQYEELLANEH